MSRFRPQIGLVEEQTHSKVLVISNWRSAGSFISSIIGAHPATLQHPEVLKVVAGMHKVNQKSNKANQAIQYLRQLLTCDFSFIKKGKKNSRFLGVASVASPFSGAIRKKISKKMLWLVYFWIFSLFYDFFFITF